ncbi:YdcF family protein [Clostridium luticellarii]|uniref:Vancomycin high temperature exclusion protein n=1 Tax=Clostridium luticellarii TaxID=1691940 RepID=A0A2T0BJF2_9CLOT|nr:YdcF family protein [Clostridium luticellarii]MCI1944081.1 YdcF family protein [Clostridium luticellarii]MCI1967277.1 YdcF family protein [Clostridium luticellarii]MCI1995189.1 YdcF family protein [Clostridium luticellarii]MCI2039315.1 YdcF family protein [Clostridium luticellarii]PRR84010.1 vancomycin high temperature exclusion protein [Clostridium luticellarii]
MSKKLKFIVCFITVAFVTVLLTEFQVVFFGENAAPEKSDCIIVLGCRVYGTSPSPFLVWRLNRGLELYNKGYGKYIIVSGGKGEGENISEAEAMKTYLISRGMDGSKVIAEDKSASTMANLINSKKIMDQMGFKDAVIISNKYHLKRASLMAQSQHIDATYSGVFVSSYKKHEIIGYIREIPAMWKYYFLKLS